MYRKYLAAYDKVFEYEKSLKIAQISHSDVLQLKEKVKNNKNVPENFPDRMVANYSIFLRSKFKVHTSLCLFSFFHSSTTAPMTLKKLRKESIIISSVNEMRQNFSRTEIC